MLQCTFDGGPILGNVHLEMLKNWVLSLCEELGKERSWPCSATMGPGSPGLKPLRYGNLSVVCKWKAFNRFLENWAQIGKEVRPDLLKSFWSFWFGKLSWGLPQCRCLQGFCLPQRQVKEVRERADVDEPIRRFQMVLVISSHNPCMSLGNCKSDVLLCRQTSA